MRSRSFTILWSTALLITIINPAKRLPYKAKHRLILKKKQEKSGHYQPNPIVLAGVGEIMNGALSIAQDPHNHPQVGHSVANMVHGIATIIIEKIAHKKLTSDDKNALQECCNEVSSDLSEEIIDMII